MRAAPARAPSAAPPRGESAAAGDLPDAPPTEAPAADAPTPSRRAAAVAAEAAAPRSSPAAGTDDDERDLAESEDLDDSGLSGAELVARELGGRVIGESGPG